MTTATGSGQSDQEQVSRARDAAARVKGTKLKTAATAAAAIFSSSTREATLWHAPPPSLSEVHKYIQEGHFMPGDQRPWLEAAGKVYGYGLALPAAAALYGLAWVTVRPGRLAATIGIAAVVLGTMFWPAR